MTGQQKADVLDRDWFSFVHERMYVRHRVDGEWGEGEAAGAWRSAKTTIVVKVGPTTFVRYPCDLTLEAIEHLMEVGCTVWRHGTAELKDSLQIDWIGGRA